MNLADLSEHWCNGRISSAWMRRKSYSAAFGIATGGERGLQWRRGTTGSAPNYIRNVYGVESSIHMENGLPHVIVTEETRQDTGCYSSLFHCKRGLDDIAVPPLKLPAAISLRPFLLFWLSRALDRYRIKDKQAVDRYWLTLLIVVTKYFVFIAACDTIGGICTKKIH